MTQQAVRRRRVLVVDDEALLASLLARSLEASGFVTYIASDVIEATTALDTFDPDVVLLDISLGEGPSGLELGHVITKRRPDIALLFVTKHPDGRSAGGRRVDPPPGAGFLRKDGIQDFDHLVQSIEAVLADKSEHARHDINPAKPLVGLTNKQVDALRLIAMGYTNERIAAVKGVAESTVERWVIEIYAALGISKDIGTNRRVEAARRFIDAAGLPERS